MVNIGVKARIGENLGPSGDNQSPSRSGTVFRAMRVGVSLDWSWQIETICQVRFVSVSMNSLSDDAIGCLPGLLGSLSSLQSLDLHDNRLTGENYSLLSLEMRVIS